MSASILIVEDEEPLQVLLSYNLEAEGYRPRTAGSGEEVPLLITEERPDLIILDWMLPGISGIEVCRLLLDVVGEAAILRGDSPGAVLRGELEVDWRACQIQTFGGGVNEIQREIVAMLALGMPRAPR